ncbi:hypothetical protein ABK040_011331 [Willaertia magna]
MLKESTKYFNENTPLTLSSHNNNNHTDHHNNNNTGNNNNTSRNNNNTIPEVIQNKQGYYLTDILETTNRQTTIIDLDKSLENDFYYENNDNDSTNNQLLTTHDGGKPIKKPFFPNFTKMSKKEKLSTFFHTSKFLVLAIGFLLFGIFFSIHNEVNIEELKHTFAISLQNPSFLYFKKENGPLERFKLTSEIPLLGNEKIYEIRKYFLENNLFEDWNITFQLQRNDPYHLQKAQNPSSSLNKERNDYISLLFDENNQEHDEERFIDVANETFVLQFIPKITSNKNLTDDNKNQTLNEEEIKSINAKFILQSDLSKLSTNERNSFTTKSLMNLLFKNYNTNSTNEIIYRLKITTNFPYSIFSLNMEVLQQPYAANYQTVFAAIILLIVYILIVFELIHRTMAAMIGSFLVLSVLSILNARPSLHEITSWIEYETIGLLFGMMIMVGIFSNTGFFEWTALQAYRLSKGKIWSLTIILCAFTAIASAFLDNVTTILLMAPVTIRLCKVLGVSPIPIIISEVIFSNIGGTATAVGDPPIVIIINDPGVKAAGIGFFDVTLYLAPCALIIAVFTFPLVRLIYWKYFKSGSSGRKEEGILPADNERLQREKEIEIWEQTLKKTKGNSIEELKVKEKLQIHVVNLKQQLNEYLEEKKKEMRNNSETPYKEQNNGELSKEELKELSEMYCIHNPRLFVICSIVLVITIIIFFIESFIHEYVHLNLAWIAIIGSVIMLLLAGVNHDFDEILEKVEWSTLLFFAALFILMEGLSELGLIEFIGNVTADLIASVPNNLQLFVAITLLCWVSAFVSAFIDNIPYVTAMIPVVLKLSEDPINLPIKPIMWALALGTCLGGNGTLIGASANVVAAGICEASGNPIGFVEFMKLGLPCMILSVAITNIYLVILHVAIGI